MDDTTSAPVNIIDAISRLQGELRTVGKGSRATVPTKSGGSYSYTYSNLADIEEVVLPLLAKFGLAFICRPTMVSGRYTLVGQLEHVTGGKRDGLFPLTGNTPQEIGSSMTYGRRYLLGCLTGVVAADEDDDGQAASPPIGRGQQNGSGNGGRRNGSSRREPPPDPQYDDGPPPDAEPGPPPAANGDVLTRFTDRIRDAKTTDALIEVAKTVSQSKSLTETQKNILRGIYDERMTEISGAKR